MEEESPRPETTQTPEDEPGDDRNTDDEDESSHSEKDQTAERPAETRGSGNEGESPDYEDAPPYPPDEDESPGHDGSPPPATTRSAEEETGTAVAQDGEHTEVDPTHATERDMADTHVPDDVQTYDRFKKIDGATYERVNEFLRDRTYITAREWAISRLCADFRTETGVEMTKIGEHLPDLVPFMTDTYSPQAVNQARYAFENKVRKSGSTFLYGAMSDFFTAEELDDVMYECTEVAKFLLEVEGVELTVEEEMAAEDRISSVMREVREASDALRHEDIECPSCGHRFGEEDADRHE